MLSDLKRALVYLDRSQRRRWAGLVPLAVLAAGLEAVGAATVFALIAVLAEPARALSMPILSWLLRVIDASSDQRIVLVVAILVALFYIAKNAYLGLLLYVRNKVGSETAASLARALLGRYLSAPYAFHLRRNSADLMHETIQSVDTLFNTVFGCAVSLLTEVLVVVGLVCVLATLAPLVAIAATVALLLVVAVLVRSTRRASGRWGARRQELGRSLLRHLQQGLGALKELKVLGRVQFFRDAFARDQDALARIKIRHAVLGEAPRLLIETLFVCGMVLVVLLLAFGGQAEGDLFAALGLFAYAGFRVIPSLNRIVMCLNIIRHGTAATSRLHEDYTSLAQLPPAVDDAEVAFERELRFEGVSYAYEAGEGAVLHDLDLRLSSGESVGVVGPTGAGKSTLLDLALGFLEPTSGRITVDGSDIRERLAGWRRRIGYVPQTVYLIDDSLRRNIALGLPDTEIDEARVQAAVRAAQLEPFVGALPDGLDTVVGEGGIRCSGGERQRIAIARALYRDPQLLIFDEATSALDSQTERDVVRALACLHGRKTLLVVAHRLSTVRGCDRIVLLKDGRIQAVGSYDELMEQSPEFRALATATDAGES